MIETTFAILTGINVVLTIVNTYWAWRRTCYNRDTLKESRDYWSSWEKRKLDVAAQVMQKMGIETPEELATLIKRLKELESKEKKKGRKKKNE